MKCIVGLGNPGEKYGSSRHNIGFTAIDAYAGDVFRFQKKHNSCICKTSAFSKPLLLVKPQTYMNLSGKAVRSVLSFYKIPLEDLLVIHDDLDLPFLKMRFQKNRGHGGHNGIRNIHQELGSKNYARLKIGIGPLDERRRRSPQSASLRSGLSDSAEHSHLSPSVSFSSKIKTFLQKSFLSSGSGEKPQLSAKDYVLSSFTEDERLRIQSFLPFVKEAAFCFIEEGFEKAAQKYNFHQALKA